MFKIWFDLNMMLLISTRFRMIEKNGMENQELQPWLEIFLASNNWEFYFSGGGYKYRQKS